MMDEANKRYISYADVLEWIDDLEFTHKVVVSWILTLARKRGSGQIVQEIRAVVRRREDDGSFKVLVQTFKAFGKSSDHATLPGAMIACLAEADRLIQEKEGRRLEEDPHAGRNPFA